MGKRAGFGSVTSYGRGVDVGGDCDHVDPVYLGQVYTKLQEDAARISKCIQKSER